jgi:hypothetical protein
VAEVIASLDSGSIANRHYRVEPTFKCAFDMRPLTYRIEKIPEQLVIYNFKVGAWPNGHREDNSDQFSRAARRGLHIQ